MPGLTLHVSNRLENLADRLAQIVREPVGDALQPETVVVQSRGMQRWLSMELARRNGICANTVFPFPNAFLEGVFQRLFPRLPEVSPFEPDIMALQIMKRLPDLLQQPEFETLRRYLHDDPNQLKLYQLAERIAGTFDQYLVFRPQMIFAWDKRAERCEPPDRWQPMLWREISRGRKELHRAHLQKMLLDHLQPRPTAEPLLPARVHMFGVSYLPPFHLQAFVAMARVARVHIFLLNPCREYWADILDTRDIQRITRRYTIEEQTEAYYYLDRGNPLLASMGTLGRDFFSLVSDTDCEVVDCFSPPDSRSLLGCIQSDILNLVDRDTASGEMQAAGPPGAGRTVEFPAGDGSIQIHACHSPIREIEVLHDQLLAMFDRHPDLKPGDIVVMTPDIESYAPFIDAVFGTHPDPSSAIPYSIADQSARRTSPTIDAFCRLLSLKGSRLGVSQVMSMLDLPGVAGRFGLCPPDVDRITGWIEGVNIRWGRDAGSRSALGLPAVAQNTWKEGIDRLLLGLAMPETDAGLFAGILPYDAIEGRDGAVLGKLLEFLQQVFQLSDTLQQPCSALRWQQRLSEVMERFLLPDERSERDFLQIRQALERLGQMETDAAYDRDLSVEVVTAFMENCFQRSPHASGFISGGVTFCAMLPMRSIPFRIVCLAGMNSDAMPRDQRSLGFDLIGRHPQPGDRSRRNDDKYLFLEAILSARQTLYISYVGQSIEDNAAIPPSVLVSELIDTLQRGFGLKPEAIVNRHPLQAFSPRYFSGENTALLSYSRENFEAVRSSRRNRFPAPFISSPLPQPPPESKQLTLEELRLFFHHPVRYLLQNRLSLRLEEPASPRQDHEPFQLDPLTRHKIGQALFERGLAGTDLAAHFPVERAAGRLPSGTVGETTYRGLRSEAQQLVSRVKTEVQDRKPQQQPIDLQIGGFQLLGVLTDLYPQGRVQCRFARTTARDVLSAWIAHLCLGLLEPDSNRFRTWLVTREATLQFAAVEQPDELLADLLRIYWEGLHAPLHFFPEQSLEFFRLTFQKGRRPADATASLRRKWMTDEFSRGLLDDPYVRICFERVDPLDDSFRELARRVFLPISQHAAGEGGSGL